MNMLKIPTRNDLPAYTERVSIDGATYTFEFKFIQRLNLWDLTIYDANGGLLLAGVTMVGNYPLKLRHKIPGLFTGDLVLLDSTGQDRSPDRDTLGVDVNLFYVKAS